MKREELIIKGAANKPVLVDLTITNPDFPLVIFVHGFKGFKDWGTHHLTSLFFSQNGFNFLKFNFSHNGTTLEKPKDFNDLAAFGSNTFTKELFDLDHVINFATGGSLIPAPPQIALIGHSRGGGISIIKAAEDQRINKLVTWASISDFRSLWKASTEESWKKNGVIYIENARTKQQMPLNIELLEDLLLNGERLDILKAASRIKVPWLIVHGDQDTSVAFEKAHLLSQQNEKSELQIIPEADHVFNARHPWKDGDLPKKLKEACEKTLRFLQE